MRATFLLVVLVVFSGCGKSGGLPSDWTHRDVAEHFNSKNLGFKFINFASGSGVLPPSGYFVPQASGINNWQEVEAAIRAGDRDIVFCELRKSPQEAKDTAGTWGERGFSSGRFAFKGDPNQLSRIRAALP